VLSLKMPEFCSVGGARYKKAFFAFLGYHLTVLRTAYRKIYPKPLWYRWKADTLTLKVCLLLVWRVCGRDQAFGRYRPLKGVEKWPSRKLKIIHVENSLIPKMLFFSIYDEK